MLQILRHRTEAEERAVAELAPAYDDIYQQLVALMDTKVTDGDNLSKRLSLVSYAVFWYCYCYHCQFIFLSR